MRQVFFSFLKKERYGENTFLKMVCAPNACSSWGLWEAEGRNKPGLSYGGLGHDCLNHHLLPASVSLGGKLGVRSWNKVNASLPMSNASILSSRLKTHL